MESVKFRIYYISVCEEATYLFAVVENGFGNSCELEFETNDNTTSDIENQDLLM